MTEALRTARGITSSVPPWAHEEANLLGHVNALARLRRVFAYPKHSARSATMRHTSSGPTGGRGGHVLPGSSPEQPLKSQELLLDRLRMVDAVTTAERRDGSGQLGKLPAVVRGPQSAEIAEIGAQVSSVARKVATGFGEGEPGRAIPHNDGPWAADGGGWRGGVPGRPSRQRDVSSWFLEA